MWNFSTGNLRKGEIFYFGGNLNWAKPEEMGKLNCISCLTDTDSVHLARLGGQCWVACLWVHHFEGHSLPTLLFNSYSDAAHWECHWTSRLWVCLPGLWRVKHLCLVSKLQHHTTRCRELLVFTRGTSSDSAAHLIGQDVRSRKSPLTQWQTR